MAENLCVQRSLQIRYSFSRVQWLIGTISLSCLIYLTSEEIWTVFDGNPFPEVTFEGMIYYSVFFLAMLVVVHYLDTRRIVLKRSVAICTSLISIVVDLCIVSFSEFIVLHTIQVLPQNYLQGIIVLLLGAMPSCLGSIVLSSLTAETLKKRARKLLEETKGIGKQIAELEDQREKAMKDLESFERKRREFEAYFEKQEREDKEGASDRK